MRKLLLVVILFSGCAKAIPETNRSIWILNKPQPMWNPDAPASLSNDPAFEGETYDWFYHSTDQEWHEDGAIHVPKGTKVVITREEGEEVEVVTREKPHQRFLVSREWISD